MTDTTTKTGRSTIVESNEDCFQIVIAWTEDTGLEPTGRTVMRDLNWFPEFRPCAEGKACMWLNRGTEADLQKAKGWAAKEDRQVYVFPLSEEDPLGKAKAAALKGKKG